MTTRHPRDWVARIAAALPAIAGCSGPTAPSVAPAPSADDRIPPTLAIAIDAEGQVFLADEALSAADWKVRVTTAVKSAAQANPATEVQLRADIRVPYGRVAELIGLVQDGGLSRIGFVTDGAPR